MQQQHIQFRVDIRRKDADQSLTGYPKSASNESRARLLAEQAARDLETAHEVGEYIVVVSLEGKDPISSEVVIVTPD